MYVFAATTGRVFRAEHGHPKRKANRDLPSPPLTPPRGGWGGVKSHLGASLDFVRGVVCVEDVHAHMRSNREVLILRVTPVLGLRRACQGV